MVAACDIGGCGRPASWEARDAIEARSVDGWLRHDPAPKRQFCEAHRRNGVALGLDGRATPGMAARRIRTEAS